MVELSDGTSYVLSADVRRDAGLHEDDATSATLLEDLQARSARSLAEQRGLALLARSMHSRQALSLKLRQRGFPPEAVATALERLTDLGYLDDTEFARLWVRSRVERAGEGRAKVLAGLQARGIGRGDAQEALDHEYPWELEEQVCRTAAERLAARAGDDGLEVDVLRRRLAQRGFGTSVIIHALEALGAAPEAER